MAVNGSLKKWEAYLLYKVKASNRRPYCRRNASASEMPTTPALNFFFAPGVFSLLCIAEHRKLVDFLALHRKGDLSISDSHWPFDALQLAQATHSSLPPPPFKFKCVWPLNVSNSASKNPDSIRTLDMFITICTKATPNCKVNGISVRISVVNHQKSLMPYLAKWQGMGQGGGGQNF